MSVIRYVVSVLCGECVVSVCGECVYVVSVCICGEWLC